MRLFQAGRIALMATLSLVLGSVMSRADFQVKVFDDGTDVTSSLTLIPLNNATQLSYFISGTTPDFSISSVQATSNSVNTSATQAIVKITGGPIKSTDGADHTLTIMVSDNAFTFPTGTALSLGSSESDTYSGVLSSDDTHSYQSFVDRGATLFGTGDVSSPGYTFGLVPNTLTSPTGSNSHNEMPVAFSATSPHTYSITAVMSFTASSDLGATLNPTDSAIVNAVPEPASAVLVGLGLAGVVLASRRGASTKRTEVPR